MSCRKWEAQILRWQEGGLDQGAEGRLQQHLESCVRCRTLADKFSELDGLFSKCREPSLPPFLTEKIVSALSEEIRADSMRGIFSRFFGFFDSFRPAVVGAVLVLGIVLGAMTGWNLAQSVSREATVSSHDLLSLAGFGASETGTPLEFIWTDSSEGAGQ